MTSLPLSPSDVTSEPVAPRNHLTDRRSASPTAGTREPNGAAPTSTNLELVHRSETVEVCRINGHEISTSHLPGYPIGSIVVKAMNGEGRPVFVDKGPATTKGAEELADELAPRLGLDRSARFKMEYVDTIHGLLGNLAQDEREFLLDGNQNQPFEPHLVHPTVAQGVTSLLIGPSGSMKSTQALVVAIAHITGRQIGPYVPTGKPSPVLYLDGEDVRATHDLRVRAIGQGPRHRPQQSSRDDRVPTAPHIAY